WFVPATMPSAVLLVPASGASKRAMLPYLKFLHTAGFPALIVDSPDFLPGRAGWGWSGHALVRNAAKTLRSKGYTKVAALGISEGAAPSLMAQAESPDTFDAIVADSSFAAVGEMLRNYPSLAGLNPAFLRTIMWELSRALGRDVDEISPQLAATRLGANCAL